MAALTPVMAAVQTALPILNSVSTLSNQIRTISGSDERRQQELAMRNLQERQTLDMQNAQAQAGLDRQSLATKTASEEAARRDALRRAVSRQRALFGGSGVSANGGSSEAVLLGLFEESEDERAEREKLDGLRNQAIDLSLSGQNSLNVLQRSQLEARHKLQRTLF